MSASAPIFKPAATQNTAWSRAMITVGTIAETPLNGPLDEVRLTRCGIKPGVMDALKQLGASATELNWIIKPRTLTHRKAKNEKLTPEETGRWLRAAKVQALADEVFGNKEKAVGWLHKPRKRFDNQSAMTLIQSEAGAQLVEETLNQIDAGYFA